jgi:zinc transport system substrate-binding protein
VTEGVATPFLIVRGSGSPHTYQMRPSEAGALAGADLVLWIGETLETFLVRPLASLAADARRVSLIEAPGLKLLAARAGGAWEEDEHEGATGARIDPHVWLSPDNAAAMVRAIASVLSEVDPGNGEAYRANRDRLLARIDALARELEERLAPVRDVPFVVFHDSYRYLEDRFGLNAVGSITVGLERPPGARRLRALRAKIRETGAKCVFSEPQFESPLVEAVVEGSGAGRGTLDPLGASLEPGADAYFEMMDSLARAMIDCLSRRR